MPRPRSFDDDAVVDAAMRTFWATGYEATSTERLCQVTGLRRGSLYNAFPSKHALFLAALERYTTERTDRLVEALAAGRTARSAIHALLGEAVDEPAEDPPGCLVVNTMAELGSADEAVNAVLARDRRRRIDALAGTVARGQRAGDVGSTRRPEDLAEFVLATVNGLRVAARAGVDPAARRAVADTALDAV